MSKHLDVFSERDGAPKCVPFCELLCPFVQSWCGGPLMCVEWAARVRSRPTGWGHTLPVSHLTLFSFLSHSLCLVLPYVCDVGGCRGVGGCAHQHVLNTDARLQPHPSTVGIPTSLFSLRLLFSSIILSPKIGRKDFWKFVKLKLDFRCEGV